MLTSNVVDSGFEPRSDNTKNNNKTNKMFEDTKGVFRSRKSKDRQHKDQMKKDKKRSTKHKTIILVSVASALSSSMQEK